MKLHFALSALLATVSLADAHEQLRGHSRTSGGTISSRSGKVVKVKVLLSSKCGGCSAQGEIDKINKTLTATFGEGVVSAELHSEGQAPEDFGYVVGGSKKMDMNWDSGEVEITFPVADGFDGKVAHEQVGKYADTLGAVDYNVLLYLFNGQAVDSSELCVNSPSDDTCKPIMGRADLKGACYSSVGTAVANMASDVTAVHEFVHTLGADHNCNGYFETSPHPQYGFPQADINKGMVHCQKIKMEEALSNCSL